MQARLMSSVPRQARMLDSITADLLTAAQIQRGTLRIDLAPLDPRTVVESVAGDRYGIDVEVTVEDDRMVRADPLRLEQTKRGTLTRDLALVCCLCLVPRGRDTNSDSPRDPPDGWY